MDLFSLTMFYLFSCVLWVMIGIPIHELGHLVFGLFSGYKFGSFKLFNLVWAKEEGKIVLRKSENNVIIGQCLMAPPKDEKQFKFIGYNLGGGLLNILVAVILLIFLVIFNYNNYMVAFLLAGVAMSAILGITNLVPMSSEIPNDGKNIQTALESEEAKHGLYIMLFVNDEASKGLRYKDLEENIFDVKAGADYHNYFVAYLIMCEAARLFDLGEYDSAIEKYKLLNLEKLPTYYRNSVLLDYLYYYILNNPDFDKAREIYEDSKMKKFLKMGNPSVTRALSAYEFFVHNDHDKGRLLLKKAREEVANFPSIGVRLMESEYLDQLEEMMRNAF